MGNGSHYFEYADMATLNRTPRPAKVQVEDGLFNDVAPGHTLAREKPVHRLIISLAQQGMTNAEIAAEVEMTPHYVGDVLKQPWARERIVREVKENTRNEIQNMFKGAVKTAAENIIAALRSEDEQVMLRASNNVLDRVLGKAVQPVEEVTTDLTKLTDEELERRIAAAAGN